VPTLRVELQSNALSQPRDNRLGEIGIHGLGRKALAPVVEEHTLAQLQEPLGEKLGGPPVAAAVAEKRAQRPERRILLPGHAKTSAKHIFKLGALAQRRLLGDCAELEQVECEIRKTALARQKLRKCLAQGPCRSHARDDGHDAHAAAGDERELARLHNLAGNEVRVLVFVQVERDQRYAQVFDEALLHIIER